MRNGGKRRRAEALKKWVVTGGLVALVLVVVALGYYAMVVVPGQDRQRAAESASRVTAASASPTATPTATTVAAIPAPVVTPGERVLFLGDSWTFGSAASSDANRFAQVAADKLGAEATIMGYPGVGYLNPGRDKAGTFAQRFAADRASMGDPETIVIEGSVNDLKYPQKEIQAAAVALVAQLRADFPGAEVLIVGPAPATTGMIADLQLVDAALRRGAAEAEAPYASSLREGWIPLSKVSAYMDPRNGDPHPNDAGHKAFGEALASALDGP